MNDDEFTRQLRHSLQQHRPEPLDHLAESAIHRAGVRRRNQQAAAAVLGLAAVAGVGFGALNLARGTSGDQAAAPVSGTPSSHLATVQGEAPTCDESNASWGVGKGTTSNGITTYLIRVRPMGLTSCTIGGVPGFWLADAQGTIVGAPAEHAGETGAPVVATEDHPATAAVRYDTTLVRDARCQRAKGFVRMFAPGGSVPMGTPRQITGCRNAEVKPFSVTSFVPG